MRVILDTNVVVAGLRSSRGASHEILRLIGTGRFEIALSIPMAFEYEEQLKKQARSLGLTTRDVDEFLDFVYSEAIPAEVFFLWRPTLTDADDDFVLEAAVAGNCDAIVTFNVRDFAAARRHAIRIIRPGDFLQELNDE